MRKGLASLVAVGAKFLGIFAKLLKSVKVIKIGLAGASLAAYSWMFTWQFAAVLLLALVIHEYGHLRAMHACGIPTKGIFLIPFLGGAAVAEEGFATRRDESYVAMMGPIWGLGTALIPFFLYFLYPHPGLAGIASFIAMMNLFNMLPVNPLDGGRTVKSIAFSLNSGLGVAALLVGMVGVFAGMLFLNIGLFLLIGFIASMELAVEWRVMRRGDMPLKPQMTNQQILIHSAMYISLITAFVTVIVAASMAPGADVALKALTEGGHDV